MAEGRIKDWIEKLGIEGIDTLVRRDTRKAYRFYQGSGETEERLPARGVRRYAAASKAVFISFLRKLTPARRLSYLVALFLFARAFVRNEWGGAVIGFVVVNFLLALELAEKLLTKNELEIARAIQFSLYPVRNPRLERLDLASFFRPAQEVGGDYYDFAFEGNRRLTLILGDVSGKGIAAALYAMKLQALFELLGRSALGPKEMLVEMNDVISERIERNYFITAVVGALDLQDRKLVLARAGHNYPLRYCARTGRAVWLNPNGIGIGMCKKPAFDALLEEVRIPLAKDDVLVFYTDGLTEAMNSQREPFGYLRLEQAVAASAGLPAEAIKDRLLSSLESFRRGEAYSDDVTLVVAKIL